MKNRILLACILFISLPLVGADQPAHVRVAKNISLLELAANPDDAVKSIALDGLMTESVDYLAANALELATSNLYRLAVDDEARDRFLTNVQLHHSLVSIEQLNEQEKPTTIPLPQSLHLPAHAILSDICRRNRNFFIPVERKEGSFYQLAHKQTMKTAAESAQKCRDLRTLHAQLKENNTTEPTLLTLAQDGTTSALTTKTVHDAYTSGTNLNIWQQFPPHLFPLFRDAILPPKEEDEEEDIAEISPQQQIRERWKQTGKLRESIAEVCLEQGHQKLNAFKKTLPQQTLDALTNIFFTSKAIQASGIPAAEKRAVCERIAKRLLNRIGIPASSWLAKQFTTDDRCLAQQKCNPFSYSFARYDKDSQSLHDIAPSEAVTLLHDEEAAKTVFLQHRPGFSYADDLPDASLLTTPFFLAQKDSDVITPIAFNKLSMVLANPPAYTNVYWRSDPVTAETIRYVRPSALAQSSESGMDTFEVIDNKLVREQIPPFTISPGLLSEYGSFGFSLLACHGLHTFFRSMRTSFLMKMLTKSADATAAILGNHPTSLNHQQEVAQFFTRKHTYITYSFFTTKALLTVITFIAGITVMEQASKLLSSPQKMRLLSFGQAWSHRVITAFNHWRLAPVSGGPEQLSSLSEQFQHELLTHLKQYGAVTVPIMPAVELLFTGHTQIIPDLINALAIPSDERYANLAQRIFLFKGLGLSQSPYPKWYHTMWLPVVQKIVTAFFMLRCLDKQYARQWGRYVSQNQPALKQILSQYGYYAARNSEPTQILSQLRDYIGKSMPLIGSSLVGNVLKKVHQLSGARIITSGATGYHALMTARTYTNTILLLPILWQLLTTHTALSEYPWAQPTALAGATVAGISASIAYHFWLRRHEEKKYSSLRKTLHPEPPQRSVHAT